jgi:polysaccharide export outer membrane protein
MKAVKLFQNIGLVTIVGLVFAVGASAQEIPEKKVGNIASAKKESDKAEKPVIQTSEAASVKSETAEPDKQIAAEDKKDDKNLRTETLSETEAAIIPYYNSYMKEYRLGPQDIISVEVFGQCPDYCKGGITVPPTARISYPLIKEGVFVGGKTVYEVQEDIRKQLDEYIIEPSVIVTLEKVGSARFSVLGDVGQPGVKMMERRVSVYEAIVESGGITRTGDKKRVTVVRQTQNGLISIPVNLDLIARGKAEMIYLVPGDQVIVPGNKIKTLDKAIDIISKVSVFRLLFGSPF